MPKSKSDSGIVLRLRPFSEYDALVTVFTESSGKETYIAKGLRRPKSRMCGLIQPLTGISFEHSVPNSPQGLAKIIRAELLFAPPDFHSSFPLLTEIAEKISPEGESFPDYLQLLREISTSKKKRNILALFLTKTLTAFGYLPLYELCATTGEKISGECIWHDNGQISEARFTKQGGMKLSFDELKVLSFWQKQSFENGEKVSLSAETEEKFIRFFLQFLEREHGVKVKNEY